MAHQLTLNTTALEELKAAVQALPAEKKLQSSKTVTPSTSAQTVSPDSGYDGIASVTVTAIPDAYQDVTGVDAIAVDVVEGKKIVSSTGETVTGTNPYVKTTTDTEVNSQASKLAELKTILEGKAAGGGGGSFDYCSLTLTIESYMGSAYHVSATSVNENGSLSPYYQEQYIGAEETQTFQINVLQGSTLSIFATFSMCMEGTLSSGATIVSAFNGGAEAVFQVGAESSASWTIIYG